MTFVESEEKVRLRPLCVVDWTCERNGVIMASSKKIQNRWDDAVAKGMSEPELLRYRSNLLGGDLTLTNFAGGNTSCKVTTPDPLTRKEVEVMWVKGSGGDLGSMGLDGFSTLYMEKLQSLKGLYRGLAHEDEMVDYLPH